MITINSEYINSYTHKSSCTSNDNSNSNIIVNDSAHDGDDDDKNNLNNNRNNVAAVIAIVMKAGAVAMVRVMATPRTIEVAIAPIMVAAVATVPLKRSW